MLGGYQSEKQKRDPSWPLLESPLPSARTWGHLFPLSLLYSDTVAAPGVSLR